MVSVTVTVILDLFCLARVKFYLFGNAERLWKYLRESLHRQDESFLGKGSSHKRDISCSICQFLRIVYQSQTFRMLRKVLKQVEIIKSSRSGTPNFDSHEVEANDLQSAVEQYLQVRGTVKASRNIEARYGVNKDASVSSTKAWLEKMRTLFIRKGSRFSSRSVITGDAI
ncbi:hypothetical protein F3Y22_tig00012104pilonHSYRG00051 [Hibiscus syriacus]|uniref:DNA-directed RNA polymerase n=1 Tax=Hibiscus syriacus TaxID=106335 RepID=A0A6A3C703_HIBSY|nr:hypothetical protein F3Y22_tig00012104pilonHSYRG00051 [Hibiscus syriacus]